jgi:signal transduction histidine kinase
LSKFQWDLEILEYLPVGIMIVNPDLKITFWNTMMELWTEIQRNQILGCLLIEKYPHLNNPVFLQRLKMIFSGGPPAIFSPQLHRHVIPCKINQEHYRIQNTTVRAIKIPNEKNVFALFVIEDYTELSNMVNDQKERNREMNLFLDILTHDLNNYFLSSLGYLDISMAEIQEHQSLDCLELTRAGIQQASELVKSISIMMKTRVTRAYDLQPVNLLEVVKSCNKDVKEMFPLKDIEIKMVNIDSRIHVRADSLFQQLILNLLTNAVKNDINENIIIDIEYKSVSERICHLRISDRGKGIDPMERKGIFNRYTQFRKRGKGSGLGLFIVKTLVERYEGKIWIESRVTNDYINGTVFIIELQVLNV